MSWLQIVVSQVAGSKFSIIFSDNSFPTLTEYIRQREAISHLKVLVFMCLT